MGNVLAVVFQKPLILSNNYWAIFRIRLHHTMEKVMLDISRRSRTGGMWLFTPTATQLPALSNLHFPHAYYKGTRDQNNKSKAKSEIQTIRLKKNYKIAWIYPRNWSFTSITETFLTMQELIISPIKKAVSTSLSEPRWWVWKIFFYAFGLCGIQTCINSSTQVDKNKQNLFG